MAILSVVPATSVPPGTTLQVFGSGFPGQSFVQLVWNNSVFSPKERVAKNGTFDTTFIVPNAVNGTYVLQARIVNGSTVASVNIVVQATAPSVPTIPSAPLNLAATSGDSIVTLTWTAPTSNGGSAITGYRVYRNAVLVKSLTNVGTYQDIGLVNGVQYTYQVSAVNAVGESPKSNSVIGLPVYVPPPPSPDPAPVISNIVVSPNQTSFSVAWHVSKPAQGWVQYGTTTSYGSDTVHETSFNYTDHVQTVSGLTANTAYHFKIHAVDSIGQSSISSDQTVTTVAVDTPPPAPETRPFAAPVTTQTIAVPTTISDSTALNNWFGSKTNVPDGSVVNFPAGKVYSMTKGLLFSARNNILVNGNGAVFNISGSGSDEALSAFLMRGSHHIAIDNFVVHGGYAGVPALQGEAAHLLGLSGWYAVGFSSYIEMANVTADHIFGDFVYAEGYTTLGGGSATPSHHLWVHNNSGDNCGRNAVSPINCNDALIENNSWTRVNYHVYDFEPNFTAEQARRWTIRNETVGSYAHRSGLIGFFVRCWNPPGNAPISDVLIDTVTVAGLAANGYNGTPVGLNTRFDSPSSDVTITNCSTSRSVAGPVFVFNNITNVTLQGNTQPLLSGSLTSVSNCTGVTITPNP